MALREYNIRPMSGTLYWSILVLVVMLLASVSLFYIAPFAFLFGGAVLGLGYLAFLKWRKSRSGQWEHSIHQYRFVGTIIIYVMVFWTTSGIFTNKKREKEFWARYEPYVTNGVQHGYTFHYIDHANSYERVDSPEVNRYIEEKKPEKVKLVLEVVRDFGKLRAYSVKRVESINVNSTWTGGEPPWPALREK
jgi:hypothetical protein